MFFAIADGIASRSSSGKREAIGCARDGWRKGLFGGHKRRAPGRVNLAGVGGNLGVGRVAQANIAGVFALMAKVGQQSQRRPRHIGVHEKAHGLREKQMKGFLFGEFANKFEGGADVLYREVVFLP